MKKFFRSFMSVLVLASILSASFPVGKVLAASNSDFNSNKLWPMSQGNGGWSTVTEIHHSFKINSSPHQIDYTKEVYKSFASAGEAPTKASDDKSITPTAGEVLFLKMSNSNYFSINGDYYLGFSTAPTGGIANPGKVSHRMYRKANTAAEKKSEKALKITDSEIFLPADAAGSDLQKDYMNYMNSDPSFDGCYVDQYEWLEDFFTPTTYVVHLTDNGGKAPTITLSGWTEGGKLKRPPLTFKLTFVGGWSGLMSAENNNFYFTFDPELTPDESAKKTFVNLAMKITQTGEGTIVERKNLNQLQDSTFYNGVFGSKLRVEVTKSEWWKTIANQVYNGAYVSNSDGNVTACGKVTNYDGGKGKADPEYLETTVPDRQCINPSAGGYLDKWGVEYVKASLTKPEGSVDICGSAGASITRILIWAFCGLAVNINEFGDGLIKAGMKFFTEVTGVMTDVK